MFPLLLVLTGCSVHLAPNADRSDAVREGSTRLVQWNIDRVGDPGTDEFEAALDVLTGLNADVVSLNEVEGGDDDNLAELAAAAGYDHVVIGLPDNSDHNAILSRYTVLEGGSLSSPTLSGDHRATDQTREVVRVVLDAPSGPLTVLSAHLKAGSDDAAEFRRMGESHRVAQAAAVDGRVVVLGDWNTRAEWTQSPSTFHTMPVGLPDAYWLGSDLFSQLPNGLANDPFAALSALQLVGNDAALAFVSDEVGEVSMVAATDPAIDAASFHDPLVFEIPELGAEPVIRSVESLEAGDLVITELASNSACSEPDGEWLEIRNTTDDAIELQGLGIEDKAGNYDIVEASYQVAPGAFVVLADPGSSECGVSSDLETDLPSLNNGSEWVRLFVGDRELDITETYSSAKEGESFQWSGSGWCVDSPTPGAAATCGDGGTSVLPGDCTGSDSDGDGFDDCSDCNDSDDSVFPGAMEACNGVDDDCSGSVDPVELDTNGDGLLACWDCEEAGWWDDTRGLQSHEIDDVVGSLVLPQTCSSYNGARHDIFSDLDNENGEVECVYTGRRLYVGSSIPDHTNMNTEHTWPKSMGASRNPAQCDLHHLFPSDSWANSIRSSWPFGEVVEDYQTISGGTRYGANSWGETVFEPRDAHKGNVARAMVYFAHRYDHTLSSDEIALYQAWDQLDPVDGDELDRTWRIAELQRLPNPYVVCQDLMGKL